VNLKIVAISWKVSPRGAPETTTSLKVRPIKRRG
jgi:hypothetical protein